MRPEQQPWTVATEEVLTDLVMWAFAAAVCTFFVGGVILLYRRYDGTRTQRPPHRPKR